MIHKAELLPRDANDFQLIHGHCTNRPYCSQWATHYLLDENGKQVPGTKLCWQCAGKIMAEYRVKLHLSWQALAIRMYHVGYQLFDTKKHAEAYAAQKNAEEQ